MTAPAIADLSAAIGPKPWNKHGDHPTTRKDR